MSLLIAVLDGIELKWLLEPSTDLVAASAATSITTSRAGNARCKPGAKKIKPDAAFLSKCVQLPSET
jgi:hypothetical protein